MMPSVAERKQRGNVELLINKWEWTWTEETEGKHETHSQYGYSLRKELTTRT
jgi:hypothetical protein